MTRFRWIALGVVGVYLVVLGMVLYRASCAVSPRCWYGNPYPDRPVTRESADRWHRQAGVQ